MTTRIEDELRATFHERAADVPQSAVNTIVWHDYRPRTTRRLSRPLTALTGGIAVAAAGAGATVALLGSAAPAFAGWSPTPTSPTTGELQQAVTDCQQRLPIANLPLKLSDTRGPFTFQIYANDRAMATCTTGPSFSGGSAVMTDGPMTTPADQLAGVDQHGTSGGGGDAFTFAVGRAGANVTAATLKLADGTQVAATIQNGWFVAWWPGLSAAQSARLTTIDGSKTQTLAVPKCPIQACAGGTNTGSSTTPAGSSTTPAGSSTTPAGSSTTGTPGGSASFSLSSISSGATHGYSVNSQSVK